MHTPDSPGTGILSIDTEDHDTEDHYEWRFIYEVEYAEVE